MSENKDNNKKSAGRPYGTGICCTILIPLLMLATAYFIFPMLMYTSIFGVEVDFANCVIMRKDPLTGQEVPTNETIEIIPVNHDVKLIEAETMEGGIYALGFLHGKERLWQLKFFRLLT